MAGPTFYVANKAELLEAYGDLPEKTGGLLRFTSSETDMGYDSLINTKDNVTLQGSGSNMNDAGGTKPPTLISYSGTGAPFVVTSNGDNRIPCGSRFRDFGIVGSGDGQAGILFHKAGELFGARSVVDNVSVAGFPTGCAIRADMVVKLTVRDSYLYNCMYGFRLNYGTDVSLLGSDIRQNQIGVITTSHFDGLNIGDWTNIESNYGPGLFCQMPAYARNLHLDKVRFENNCINSTGVNWQMQVVTTGPGRLFNMTANIVNFRPNTAAHVLGDISVDAVLGGMFSNIESDTPTGKTILKIGPTFHDIRKVRIWAYNGGAVDPDGRATWM